MRLRAVVAVAVLAAVAGSAAAKERGFSTPGRAIYSEHEAFGELVDQDRRKWVAEVVFGSGPEGNLGFTVGYLANVPEGLELYAGFGTRTGPVLHYSAAVRYFLPFLDYYGYVGGGYVFQQHTNLDLWSHSGFGEVGYKWIVRHTFHFTISAGLQRLLDRSVRPGSVLYGDDIDPEFLAQELDAVDGYRYLLSFRFSRAF